MWDALGLVKQSLGSVRNCKIPAKLTMNMIPEHLQLPSTSLHHHISQSTSVIKPDQYQIHISTSVGEPDHHFHIRTHPSVIQIIITRSVGEFPYQHIRRGARSLPDPYHQSQIQIHINTRFISLRHQNICNHQHLYSITEVGEQQRKR